MELENSQHDSFVLLSKIVVENAIDHSVQAAVEISHKVAGCEEPLGYGLTQPGVDGHCQADEVQRCPTHGEQYEHHEHGQKVAEVVRLDLGARVGLDTLANLDDQNPDAQVAEGDDADGQDEVHHHHCDGVERADRLGKGARVDARVVLQRLHEPVGHDGQDSQWPDQDHVACRVLAGEQLVVFKAVTDVTVAVDGDACDVENGTNNTEPHQESTYLAVDVPCDPTVMEDSGQDQWVRVDGNY